MLSLQTATKQTTSKSTVTASSLAAQPDDTSSLLQQARMESTPPPTSSNTNKASSASISSIPNGMLSLKDSFETREPRSWKWVAGLSVQRFGSEGTYQAPSGSSAELGESTKVLMPILDFGAASAPDETGLFYQGDFRFGFAKQNLGLSSLNSTSDTTLSSVLLGFQPQVGWQRGATSLLGLGELGRLSSAPSSTSVKTNLNRSLDYWGLGLKIQQKLSRSVGGQLSWIQRSLLGGDTGSRIQSSNLEGGFTILW